MSNADSTKTEPLHDINGDKLLMSPPVACKEATLNSADLSIFSSKYNNSNFTSSASIDTNIASSKENSSVEKNETHHKTFDEASFKDHVLKVASETTMVDSQLFDENLQLE